MRPRKMQAIKRETWNNVSVVHDKPDRFLPLHIVNLDTVLSDRCPTLEISFAR